MNETTLTSSSTATREEIDPTVQSAISDSNISATMLTSSQIPEPSASSLASKLLKPSSTFSGRYQQLGMMGLSDKEVLGHLLGVKDLDGLDKLISYKHNQNIHISTFCRDNDINLTKGQMEKVLCLMESMRRFGYEKMPDRQKVGHSQEAADILMPYLSNQEKEYFYILCLNRANTVYCKPILISIGGVSGTVVDPKVIFKQLLLNGASGFVAAHNHPSNNVVPSESDLQLTRKLKEAGKLLEIQMLDHLIIGSDRYYSFADEGTL
jgi:DNA repair protein RadC